MCCKGKRRHLTVSIYTGPTPTTLRQERGSIRTTRSRQAADRMDIINQGSSITHASLQLFHPSTHAPVMGGLTYGTYGAGKALTVIGLCTFGN